MKRIYTEIIAQMKRRHGAGIAVTASTGIAACNIGGLTLHSFAGIGLGHDSTDKLIKKIKGIKVLYKRWEGTKVLIIDEGKLNGNSGMIRSDPYSLKFNSLTWLRQLYSFNDRRGPV